MRRTVQPIRGELLDRDEVLRERLRRQAVDSLHHQLDLERQEQSGLLKAETLGTALFVTVIGVALYSAVTSGQAKLRGGR